MESVAEGRGFEPRIRLHVCEFSRLVHSTTLPSLHDFNLLVFFINQFLYPRIFFDSQVSIVGAVFAPPSVFYKDTLLQL